MDKYNAPLKPKPGSMEGQKVARRRMGIDNNPGEGSSPGPSEELKALRRAHHFPSAQQPLAPGTSQDVGQTSRDIIPLVGGRYVAEMLDDDKRTPKSFYSIDDYPMPENPIPGYDTFNKVRGRMEHLMKVNYGLTKHDAFARVFWDEINPVARGEYRREKKQFEQQSTEVTASVDTSSKGKNKRPAEDISSESPLSDYTPSKSPLSDTPSEGSDFGSDDQSKRKARGTRTDKGKARAAEQFEQGQRVPYSDAVLEEHIIAYVAGLNKGIEPKNSKVARQWREKGQELTQDELSSVRRITRKLQGSNMLIVKKDGKELSQDVVRSRIENIAKNSIPEIKANRAKHYKKWYKEPENKKDMRIWFELGF